MDDLQNQVAIEDEQERDYQQWRRIGMLNGWFIREGRERLGISVSERQGGVEEEAEAAARAQPRPEAQSEFEVRTTTETFAEPLVRLESGPEFEPEPTRNITPDLVRETPLVDLQAQRWKWPQCCRRSRTPLLDG